LDVVNGGQSPVNEGFMKLKVIQLVFLSFLGAIYIGCQHRNSVLMIGDLPGGSTPETVKKQLKNLGFDSGWTEKIKTNSDDHRPRHDFIETKGPFSDLGVSGQLTLTFYNDRLMEARFTPNESERYRKLLSKRVGRLPEEPGKPKRISAEVSLSYYRDADGSVRFHWDYLPVSKQWEDWVGKYSFRFLPDHGRNS
jgi:hypothetical protein